MQHKLFIPKRIRVGYVNRDDTFTKKLAYIIYYDVKGVLRKEVSFEGWRDKKIEVQEFDNEPQSGLILNKNISRYNWGHFSSHRTMIRVYDPRGIEFEITTENLIGVLMNSDCSKRALSGEFVYAWCGPELVLLPTNAEEYTKATEFTQLQGKKIGVKDLISGCTYKTKRDGDIIYVGKFLWYDFRDVKGKAKRYSHEPRVRTGVKHHIFTKEGKQFEPRTSLEFLSYRVSDDLVPNYAEILENFVKHKQASAFVKFELVPVKFDPSLKPQQHENSYVYPVRTCYFVISDKANCISQINVQAQCGWSAIADNTQKSVFEVKGFSSSTPTEYFDTTTQTFCYVDRENHRVQYSYLTPTYTAEQMKCNKYFNLFVTDQLCKRKKINCLSELY